MIQQMIKLKLEEVLADREKTLYRLAQDTGIQYAVLWKLKDRRTMSISFDVLEKICRALECQPGDLLIYDEGKRKGK